MYKTIMLTSVLLTVAFAGNAIAATADYKIVMKNGGFEPANLNVPKDTKIHLMVTNQEDHTVEFESYELNQEQKIKSGETVDLYVGPLSAGSYPVFDDKNSNAKGNVISQ